MRDVLSTRNNQRRSLIYMIRRNSSRNLKIYRSSFWVDGRGEVDPRPCRQPLW
jgi:hypothetical protein